MERRAQSFPCKRVQARVGKYDGLGPEKSCRLIGKWPTTESVFQLDHGNGGAAAIIGLGVDALDQRM